MSLSARRAWIEIQPSKQCAEIVKVALRKESVDRNQHLWVPLVGKHPVALRKESVDRNILLPLRRGVVPVALRKESVDRNKGDQLQSGRNSQVALRKESVDRNKL